MNSLFEWLSAGLEAHAVWALIAALGWGLASVALSPCHLASVPLAVAFVRRDGHSTALRVSLALALGVFTSLLAVGAVTLAAGRIAGDLWGVGPWITAILLLLAGLYLLGVLELPGGLALNQERIPRNTKGALLIGLLLGVTLGPCTFAFFAPVIAAAFSQASGALMFSGALLGAFSLGHVAAVAAAGVLGLKVSAWLTRGGRASATVRHLGGTALLITALYVIATAP